MKQDHQGRLRVMSEADGPDEDEIRAMLQNGGFRISSSEFTATKAAGGTGAELQSTLGGADR